EMERYMTDEILRLGREITKKTGKRATFQNCPLNAEITIQSQRNRRKRGFQDEAYWAQIDNV
ncbi:MAG: hypothetical protein ABH879_05785, partial [archaeon]